MLLCTGMFLLKTAYGYGKRMFMRRFGDCVYIPVLCTMWII